MLMCRLAPACGVHGVQQSECIGGARFRQILLEGLLLWAMQNGDRTT